MAPPVSQLQPSTTNLNPIDARKEELMGDPDFAKFVKAYKVKVPLLQLRNQIRSTGKYDADDILMWATVGEIENLKKIGDYKGNKYPMQG